MRAAQAAARREHMQNRARERFGLEMGKLARRTLIHKVQAGDVRFARKLTHSRTVVVTEYAGIEVTFIYCGRTKSILTFLPPDSRETAEWRARESAVWRETARSRETVDGRERSLGERTQTPGGLAWRRASLEHTP